MSDQHPRVFWTSDRSALVEEGDARAAFLAYASADPIPDEHLALLKPARLAETGPETFVPETPGVIIPKPAPVKRTTRKPRG